MAYDTTNPFVVADAAPADRAQFYRRTYGLVAASFAVWAGLLATFFATGLAAPMLKGMFAFGTLGMLGVMALFWFGTTAAQSMAFKSASRAVQLSGLGLYILLEAIIFVPLIAYVAVKTEGHVMEILAPAGLTTGLLIAGLTATVFMTNKDFSFLRTAIIVGSFVAFGVIIAAMIFGIPTGFWFAAAMVILMAATVLYQTSQIKHQVGTDQYVGAAFILFSAFVTMLFWVIRLFTDRR